MKQQCKRLIALFLTLSMCLPMLPVNAWATEAEAGNKTSNVDVSDTEETEIVEEVIIDDLQEKITEDDDSGIMTADVSASGTCGDNLTWVLDSTGTLTISGSGDMTNWSRYGSVPWYSSYRSLITQVVIENGVTSIGNYAFYECTSLISVTIPDSVTTIGDYAFYYCISLISVTIPDSVTTIGDYAFYCCISLTSVTIPDSVTSIGKGAFHGCTSLTSAGPIGGGYSIEYGWTNSILAYAFFGCASLTNITIPDGVITIGDYAFYYCISLTSVTIPDSVTSIGEGAFFECTSLTSVTIPDSVTSIGEGAFFECTSLTSVTIPDSVTSIGDEAFYSCTALTDIYYAGSKEEWTAIVGKGNSNTLEDYGVTIHYNSTGADGDDDDDDEEYDEYDFVASGVFNYNLSWILHTDGALIITGNGDMYWESSSTAPWYSNCEDITSVSIGNGVTSIERIAFYGCCNMTSVSIGSGVTSIGQSAFEACSSLTEITIPDSVTTIGDYVFADSGLITIVIPASVTSVGSYAFYGCTALTDIYYAGSKEEWAAIVGEDNSNTLEDYGVTIHYNSTGPDDDKTDSDFFELRVDTNSFIHYWKSFYTEEYYYGSGKLYPTTYGMVLLSKCASTAEYYSMQQKLNSRLYISSVSKSESEYDWPGMCFGISATMVIAATDGLANIGDDTDYYSLDSPVYNTELRSQICYYQLLTDLDCYETDYKTCNKSLTNIFSSAVRLSTFLTALKNEAERCQEESAPFIFIFNYKVNEGGHAGETAGHAVVVCGYEDINYESDGTNYTYRIKIYDPNDTSAAYRYMDIAEDYSTFTFQDHTHAVSYETYLQNDYTNMSFVGIDSLQSDIYDLTGSSSASRTIASSSSQVQMSVSAYSAFILINADGETLTYDGETYDGTMTVYNLKESVNDTVDGTGSSGKLILTVDASDYFLLTDFEDGFELAAEIDSGYYCASASGADTILLSKDDGVVIEGDSEYTFTVAISTDLDSCEQVRISGTTSGTTQLTSDEDGAVLTTENDCTGTIVETYIGTDYEAETIDGTIVKATISDDTNGETITEVIPALATATISGISNVSTGVKLTWEQAYDASGYYIYRKAGSGSYSLVKTITSGSTVTWTDTTVTGGMEYTYYVSAYGDSAIYEDSDPASIMYLSSCSVKYINNTMYGFKVVWYEVAGASGYYIYRRNDDGTYSTVPTASVTGGSTTEWTDPLVLTGGKDYTYKVAAYYENADGDITLSASGTTKTCKYLKGGEVTALSNTSTGVKVTWETVSGANGYYVFRKSSTDSDYTQVATVGKVTSWTDTSSLTSGKNYTYKVSAIFTNSKGQVTKGGAKTTKTIKYLAPATISSLTNTSSGITVKWGKITGANGYYVYRKASGGSYSLVKTITSGSTVSYSDTAVKSKNGTTYYYYVIPYYKSTAGVVTKGAYTATKITVRLTAVSISSLTNSSSKKMTVKWSKNSSATGYQIQYSTSSSFSSYSTVTITSASTVSKVISSLTKGKTYYVRIRAYKTVSGTKYYSAWSSTKSVEISK